MKSEAFRPRIAVLALLFTAMPLLTTEAGAWWNSNYSRRMRIYVSAGTTPVLAGYTIALTFDHAGLVAAGKSQASGDDVRVAYWNGSGWTELDRILDTASAWNAANTTILFRTQATVAASSTNSSHFLYYGHPSAVFPPVNSGKVYLLSEGFETGDLEAWVGAWNGYGDSINTVNAAVVVPNAGTGVDGPLTISSSTNIASVGGVATAVTANPTGMQLTVASTAGFAAGDEIMLINAQGAPSDSDDAGKYEFLRIASVPGGTQLNLQTPVRRSYDGSSFAAQKVLVQRVPQWTTVTINSGGTLTASAWNGTTGGIVAFRATGAVTVNAGGTIDANALGYRGGTGGGGTAGGNSGESYDGYVGSGGNDTVSGAGGGNAGTGAGGSSSNSIVGGVELVGTAGYRGGGGGGGNADASVSTDGAGGGGGGGYGGGGGGGGGGGDSSIPGSGGSGGTTGVGGGGGGGGGDNNPGPAGGNAGSNGAVNPPNVIPALRGGFARTGEGGVGTDTASNGAGAGGGGGGGQYGYADLTARICLGSGGGGGGDHDNGSLAGQPGGAGGGIIFIAADSVANSGTIRANGGGGTATTDRRGAGGGGSGGSVFLHANSVTNSATLTATGGTGGAASGLAANPGGGGGAGGVGRIRIEAGSVSGTTNPTFFAGSGQPVRSGNHSAMAVTNNTTDPIDIGGYANTVADFPPQSALYGSGWFYLSATFPSTNYVTVMQGVSTTPGWQNVLNVTVANDNTLYVYEEQGAGLYPGSTVLATGTWHRIEVQFVISPTAGEAKVWLNGSLEINATGIDTGSRNIDRFIFGNFWQGDYTDPNTLYNDDDFLRALAVSPAPTLMLGPEQTTAVTLIAFTAGGLDSSVALEWQTASELNNLGFHLYRAPAAGGPYERITSSVIPGLGSSPHGATYRYLDAGLGNGVTYFYKLEDIETTGRTELHGPVWATPRAGGSGPAGGDGDPGGEGRLVYGDPSKNALRVTRDGDRGAVIELVTEGFYGVPQSDGTVRLEVPGFEESGTPGAPALPMRRVWLEAVAGRQVVLGRASALDQSSFPGLRPPTAGQAQLVVTREGTVRAGRAKRGEGVAFRGAGLYPADPARLGDVAFQREVKKAAVELSPLRWDQASQQLVLARRLVVRVAFTGTERKERSLGGSRGRRYVPVAGGSQGPVAAQLVVREGGIYGVSFEEVFGAGRRIAVGSLRLSRQGEGVAFHVEPEDGFFGPGSVMFFESEGSSLNPYGLEAVYELEVGRSGPLMATGSAAPSGAGVVQYRHLGEWEEDRTYQAGLLDAEDRWQWEAVLSQTTKSYSFTLSEVSRGTARLTVWLQGGSDFAVAPDHHVRLRLNGEPVGEASWDGQRGQVVEVDVPAVALVAGANQLTLENVGDTAAGYSIVYLNKFSLSYPRDLVAEGGELRGTFEQTGVAEVSGLGKAAVVLDVTGGAPRWLAGAVRGPGGLSIGVEAGRRYRAGSPRRAEVRRPVASALRSEENRADYLLIGPGEFLAAAAPLLSRRASQGLLVKAVAIEEVYQEFGHGETRPDAVKEFIAYAYHRWQGPSVRYVLLLGDASYDFKDHLGTGQVNRVPPLMVKTSYLWTASDPGYGAVNGEDSLPDVAIGRLSARDANEASALVEKVVAFEEGGFGFGGRAVLVADNADSAGEFETDTEAIAGLLGSRELERIYLRDLGATATRSAVLDAFDRGASLMSYVGHGAVAVWASENVLNNTDVASLVSQPEQPFLMTMNCLNGYIQMPGLNSLAEELVKAPGKGAVGAFAPSGLSVNGPAHAYQQALVAELVSGRHQRLGDAVLAAQAAYAATGAMPELLGIYHLLADPALTLR